MSRLEPPVEKLLDLGGSAVIVTGAGAGIGAGIALRFAAAGADVVVACRSNAAGAETVADRIGRSGRRAVVHQGDLTRAAEAQRLAARCVEAFGRLDVLINNARAYPVHSILEMAEAEWRAVLDANLTTVHLMTQAAARRLIAQRRGGAIVNIASIEASSPAPMHAHYNAAKAAVVMHTKAAAAELGAARHPSQLRLAGSDRSRGLERGLARWRQALPGCRPARPSGPARGCRRRLLVPGVARRALDHGRSWSSMAAC